MNNTVVILTNIPRPYRRALFRVLKARFAAEGWGLRIIYTSDPSKHVRRGSLASVTCDASLEDHVAGLSFRTTYERVVTIPSGLRHALQVCAPACVVAGGFGPSALIAAHWCGRAEVPLVIWSGAWAEQSKTIGFMRFSVRKSLARRADAFIAYGTAAADYLVALGARSDRVFCAWNTVDIDSIAASAHDAATRRVELAQKHSLAANNILFVGSLVKKKGLRELLAAMLVTDPATDDWALHLVGGGPLRHELETAAHVAGKEAHIRFHGLKPESEVTELLGLVDGFVLPAKQEAWGLVINEAMACGVPVVASPWAGATRDLIVDGVTGYVVDPSDTATLSHLMSRLLEGNPSCKEVGRAGAQAVRAKASLEKSAEGFVLAVKCALSGGGRG